MGSEMCIRDRTKGDWNEADIFFRGNGEIIGATKMDEALLDEQRKAEALEAAVEEVRRKDVSSHTADMKSEQSISDLSVEASVSSDVTELVPSADTDWFGMEGDDQ